MTRAADPVPWPTASFGAQVRVLTARSLKSTVADRRLLFFLLLQPIVLLLLFSQVFSAIAALPQVAIYDSYVNFLVPATMVNIGIATAMGTGTGLLAEIYSGFAERLRSMPINLFAVLAARTVADTVRLAALLVVTVLASVALLGFRPAGGVLGVTAALLLTLVVGWCFSWLFVAITTWLRKAETLQTVSFIVMFPLMFSSSAYMPLDAMPVWMQIVSVVNPVTSAIDAVRALALGMPVGWSVYIALTVSGAIALVGMLISNRSVRERRF